MQNERIRLIELNDETAFMAHQPFDVGVMILLAVEVGHNGISVPWPGWEARIRAILEAIGYAASVRHDLIRAG